HRLDRTPHALEVDGPVRSRFTLVTSTYEQSGTRRLVICTGPWCSVVVLEVAVKLLRLLGAVILAAGVAAPAGAQSSVTSADIQRLQDVSYEASRDVAQVRTRDAVLASQLQAELDDARDEVIYLKVKLRRNEPISRGEYNDVRDRIENIRSRARGDSAGGYTPPAGSRSESVQPPPPATSRRAQNPNEIPVGTEF